MLEIAVVLAAWLVLRLQLRAIHTASGPVLAPKKASGQIMQLSNYADRLYAERKWNGAEKAYLSVLKLDHKNFTAYVHLGIIYSTQKNMADAIECFAIATRLRPSASAFQNLALAYYDNKNYIKSIAAYEKSIMFEPLGPRYVGLGKAQLKLHNVAAAVTAFEHAVKLDPAKRILERLADAYILANRKTDAQTVYRRIYELNPTDRTAARRIGVHLPD